MALNKKELFQKRRLRVRNKLRAIANGRPRLSVHRSSKNISVQLIDDIRGITLAAASSLEKDLGVVGKNNVEAAAKIGAAIAERAKQAGVEEVIFDRGGFLFHGKIKALADAAREGGLKF
ncbi:50S ribosomal protein L18 [Paracoccus yeei]|uniref:Large ribosomal subunit protein uL18 n=2 Tax=Paracoccus TaxID=265 RepID=A0A1V0GR45_9RHOB|nr:MULTISPECIES: 50S ribosomal protein L18 [Paracoccus]ARC36324.1 50S ribosomal protein L18 [Paracoccus yeei]ATQ54894.1 50S ribosomal protein L18 [Paracoccus yeei]AWX92880.1 50S ribosomal protein L18 [Paracoccus mutanolyticus]AYF02307.1 50S ribosomal protein L18 [Paracoccus yeei]MBY0135624.1 50S ribosomal protein L18 [Paracoccus yeei]